MELLAAILILALIVWLRVLYKATFIRPKVYYKRNLSDGCPCDNCRAIREQRGTP